MNILQNEAIIRSVFFLCIFTSIAVWEQLASRRVLTTSKKNRWFSNLSLTFLNPLILRLLFSVMAVNMALKAQERGWGLLNNIELPFFLEVVIGVIILDFAIYIQHVMFHSIPILWRLHMVHHADLDFDITTGLRFHPIEMILSMGIKLSVVTLLGSPALAVLIFEIILNTAAMFNHGNIKIPLQIDKLLRYFIVTPDMHRVHHSVIIRETNSNFGFNLPWWDRLLGTYKGQPAKGHEGMTIGLAQFRDARKLTLIWLLLLPFIGDPGQQAINRH